MCPDHWAPGRGSPTESWTASDPEHLPSIKPKALLVSQCLIGAICIAVAVLAPRKGNPELLIPLSGQAAADLPALVHGRTRLLARGPTTTSLIVIDDGGLPTWRALLSSAILPLAAEGRLCGNDLAFGGNPT